MVGQLDAPARRRIRRVLLIAVAPVVMLACRGGDDGPAAVDGSQGSPGSGVESTPADGTRGSSSGTLGGTRTVPTVPPSTLPGQVGDDDGVVDLVPTIAPVPVDPAAPTTSFVPPTTDLIGDPQPAPGQTTPTAPTVPPAPGDPDACARLASFDISGVIADTAGVATEGVLVVDGVCRYAAGGFVTEVHFIPLSVVRDDWFRRPGIEPVGEVGSDVVGFGSFIPPGAQAGPGYTIALEGASDGVIVATTGTADPRRVAAQVAIYANQAA